MPSPILPMVVAISMVVFLNLALTLAVLAVILRRRNVAMREAEDMEVQNHRDYISDLFPSGAIGQRTIPMPTGRMRPNLRGTIYRCNNADGGEVSGLGGNSVHDVLRRGEADRNVPQALPAAETGAS